MNGVSWDEGDVCADNSTWDWYYQFPTTWDWSYPIPTLEVVEDVNAGGQNNIEGRATWDGTYYWFESRKLLNSGDGFDISWTPGGTYQVGVGFWTTETKWYENWNLDLTLANPVEMIEFTLHSPGYLYVTDPDGLHVGSTASGEVVNEIPAATYTGPTSDPQVIRIPNRKIGDYQVTIVPKPDADPTDTFTLEASVTGTVSDSIILANNIPIGEIQTGAYVVESTPTGLDIIDTNAPTITVTLPEAYGIYSITSGKTYLISVNDDYDPNPSTNILETDYSGNSRIVSSGTPLSTQSGLYTLTVTATDKAGNTATKSISFVIYDSSTGFATGGGWIIPEPELGNNKATFGFVAKYKKGSTTPDGNLQFQYNYRDINLKSTSIEWLVISNNKAIFQGTASINGQGTYKFRVEATDGDLTGGQADHFMIRIGLGNDISVNPIYSYKGDLQGGSIVVHK
jgi:hypothetical protein